MPHIQTKSYRTLNVVFSPKLCWKVCMTESISTNKATHGYSFSDAQYIADDLKWSKIAFVKIWVMEKFYEFNNLCH